MSEIYCTGIIKNGWNTEFNGKRFLARLDGQFEFIDLGDALDVSTDRGNFILERHSFTFDFVEAIEEMRKLRKGDEK